jgi:histidine phosphotransferase ChpT
MSAISAAQASVAQTSVTQTPIKIESLDLAALLCSRVCHDLISPVGAIVNGLEVMEDDNDQETKAFAMDLIKKSVRQASAKLQFCRLAFGAAGSAGAQIDIGDAEKVARAFLEDDKTKITWNLPRVLLPKNRVKLLLNMLLIAGQSIPRGGQIVVDPVGEGEVMSFRISATGGYAKIPQAVPELLAGGSHGGTVDAHAVQPYYTSLLAKDCGLTVAAISEGEAIVVAAR